MRPIKTLTPADLVVRGLFLAAVAVGGFLGQNRQSGAVASQTGAPQQTVVSGMMAGSLWPIGPACRASDVNTRAQAATPGQGNYTLHGVVRSRAGCAPVAGAKIEYWPGDAQAAGQPGQRAALQADSQGAYQLHCSPPAEAGRQDYIYLRVSADGFAPVLTQYRPKAGQVEDWLDIVLEPAG